jgi:hypothetical protein
VLLIELPLYLPLAWFLVRHWGIPGAATGWTLRVAVEALVFGVLVSKLFALDPHAFAAHGVGKSLLAVAALGIALAGAKLLLRESVPAQLACCVALTAVFCAIVWRKIFDRADRGQVQGLLVLTRIEPRDGLPAKSL